MAKKRKISRGVRQGFEVAMVKNLPEGSKSMFTTPDGCEVYVDPDGLMYIERHFTAYIRIPNA